MPESNSRQVPKIKSICSDKKYYDILYSYLQCASEPNEDGLKGYERCVQKKIVNFTKLSEILGVSRQTVSTKFKYLVDKELVKEKDGKYYLTILPNDSAFLIPQDTLTILVDALSENSVSTYVYLFNRFIANQEKPFLFTLDQIKTFVGISAKTRSNDTVVMNILLVLKKLGLIDYHLTTQVDESGFANIKTVYELQWVKNKIK